MSVSTRKLHEYTASELAALIRSREVSSREVIEAHLSRIDEVNDYVNAVAVVLRESALEAADAADRGSSRGPLHGVPFTIKECIDRVGSATTHGVPVLERAMPYEDAPAVARLEAAGAIPIGRTNQSEMGMRLCTDNPLRGRTMNPWNGYLTAGGSSGGDAAALATGMTPLALGTDMGGSLRSPAYCCGVAALKPTTGRIPHASSLAPRDYGMAGQVMLVVGPMARSIADLRLTLTAVAGRDVRDPRSVDAPLAGPPPGERRAASITRIPGVELPASTTAAIERAGALLAAAGWTVEPAEPPELERVAELWGEVLAVDLRDMMPGMRPTLSDALYAHLARMCRLHAGDVPNYAIHAERSRLSRAWSEYFTRYPVAIGPTWARLPWPVDADLDPDDGIALLADTTALITPANVLGLPAVALPLGLVDGLPTGVQIYADAWREDLCLEAAEIVEAGADVPTPIDPVY